MLMIQKQKSTIFILLILVIIVFSCRKEELMREAKVNTISISNIMGTYAYATGEIVDLGMGVTEYGHCWSKAPNPEVSANATKLGETSKLGNYTSKIEGLEYSTTYHIRAYVIHGEDDIIVYGEDVSFSTADGLAKLTTTEITEITINSAASGGNITDDGGSAITARGICWNTSGDPEVSDNTTSDGTGTGTFTSSLTDLEYNTIYYVRAYATNEVGTGYGSEIYFSTKAVGSVIDADGNAYGTIEIGDQIWMIENLKTTKYSDGTSIPLVTDFSDWAALSTPAYSWYNNDRSTNKETYGAIYNWFTVSTDKLCPAGWHVPSDGEWKTLEMYLGMSQVEANNTAWRGTNEGSKLAGRAEIWSSGSLKSDSEFGSSGFNALPGGQRQYNEDFRVIGDNAYWWSATEVTTDRAYARTVSYDTTTVYRYHSTKKNGNSVRCIKD
jgi:uncharacterized protein (TIGR02145 family)